MITLQIYDSTSTPTQLNFKTYKKADDIRKQILASSEDWLELVDDYGITANFSPDGVKKVILIDLDHDFKRQAEYNIQMSKTQMQAQRDFQNDPSNRIVKPVVAN